MGRNRHQLSERCQDIQGTRLDPNSPFEESGSLPSRKCCHRSHGRQSLARCLVMGYATVMHHTHLAKSSENGSLLWVGLGVQTCGTRSHGQDRAEGGSFSTFVEAQKGSCRREGGMPKTQGDLENTHSCTRVVLTIPGLSSMYGQHFERHKTGESSFARLCSSAGSRERQTRPFRQHDRGKSNETSVPPPPSGRAHRVSTFVRDPPGGYRCRGPTSEVNLVYA